MYRHLIGRAVINLGNYHFLYIYNAASINERLSLRIFFLSVNVIFRSVK